MSSLSSAEAVRAAGYRQTFLTGVTLLEATLARIEFAFDHFDTVIVSISGGKDSTVLADLVTLVAERRGRRAGLFFLDEEVVYQSTIDQIRYLYGHRPHATNKLWLQVPFNLTNATSYEEGQLHAWEPGKHKVWMRPKERDSIHVRTWAEETQTVRNKAKGFGFYDVIENFEATYTGAAFLVGERGQEAPNRWGAVVKNPVPIGGQDVFWATRRGQNVVMKPLYDWNFHDVWRYIHDAGLRYSRIYDWMWLKGMSLSEIRCSSLIHERSFKSLVELPEFEPETYARLVRRIKGVAFAQEWGKNSVARARKLPAAYKSWRTYRDFLLANHPDPEHKPIFERRFARQLDNEFVARQQVRQLLGNDYEGNYPIKNEPDPREARLAYYREIL